MKLNTVNSRAYLASNAHMNDGDGFRVWFALEHCKVDARVGVYFLQLRRCLRRPLCWLDFGLGLFLKSIARSSSNHTFIFC